MSASPDSTYQIDDCTSCDAYKLVESRIRSEGVRNLIENRVVTPINLVPLSGFEYTSWEDDLSALWGGECPEEIVQGLREANQIATKLVPVDNYPDWLKERKIFELVDHRGVYIVPQAFPDDYLEEVAQKCAVEYPFLPDTYTNLGILKRADYENVDLFTSRQRLRWISLGCNYDWTNRVYTTRSSLPPELATKAKDVASMLNMWPRYEPDCALVNYYGWSDRLRGHTDNVEEAMEMPLITFSLGQTGIFLMGGHTRQHTPHVLILRHGDCCIMSQESRADFHGVPSLLFYHHKSRKPPHTQRFKTSILNSNRINISVRQCWR